MIGVALLAAVTCTLAMSPTSRHRLGAALPPRDPLEVQGTSSSWRFRRKSRTAGPDAADFVPQLADLLALCLAAGAELHEALSAILDSAPPSARPQLEQTVALMALGVSPDAAWAHWGHEVAPLVRAFERSARTGSAVADECRRISADMRAEQLAHIQQRARSIGVKSVFPLMACFLPAFVLLGVVPVVVSLARGLLAST